MYSTVDDAVKMVVANKVDKVHLLLVLIVFIGCLSAHAMCIMCCEDRCDHSDTLSCCPCS